MLECVINVSEGRDLDVIRAIGAPAGRSVLDVHVDADHHRSVFTLAGPDVEDAARALTAAAVSLLDLRTHTGVHPRLGVVDVVPFVPLPGGGSSMADAVEARDAFATWAATTLGVPCFRYGPERTLPDVRRSAFTSLAPDAGPREPHPTAGAICAGARDLLVAYNLWLPTGDVAVAKRVAAAIRSAEIRTLGLLVAGRAQVSCNLVEPLRAGPAAAYDAVAARHPVARAELVGLVPQAVLDVTPHRRWSELGLRGQHAIEARLQAAGLDGGSG